MISNISKTLAKIKENSAQVIVEEESSFGSNSDDYLQLAEALKSSNTVEKFHLSSNWKKITNSGLQAISEGLIAQQSLNDLKINLKGALEITDDGLLPLGKALQSLSSLEKVYLGILQCGSLTEAGVCGVIENLKSSLKSLHITSDIFTDAEFPKLAQLLKAFQTLQSLELDLYSETSQLTNAAIENLKDLNTLTSLTNFAFTISSEQITDPSLQTIAHVVKNLTSLKSLSVDFNDCINLGNTAVQDLSQSLKALTSLEKIVLNFSYCSSLTDPALESLSQAIQTLSSLKSLDLSFASCGGMTDAGLQSLSEGLNKHPSLENVTLNFTNCYITDAGLQTISRALPTIASLQKTELNLGRCDKLTDAGLVNLAEPIEKLENLKDLSLNFYAGFNLTDSGLHPVIQSIGKLTSIKSISLDFTASQTSETPFKGVSDAWKNLASLEKLTLWFTSCQKANDATLLDLSNFVEKLASLKEITLGFDSCDKITGSGIQALSHSLGKLSGLKDVTLSFLGCTLNDAGFEKIGHEFEGLKSVEKLNVNFSRCNELTDQTLEELTKTCKKLGFLKVVKANFAMNTGFTDGGINKILEGEETFEKIITF